MSYTLNLERPMVFSRAQCEVLNMVACLDGEEDCLALKSVLVKFLDQRLQSALDRLYDSGKLSDAKLEDLSRRHLRTDYRNKV